MGLACDWGSWGHGTFLLNSGRVPIDPLKATSCDRLVGKKCEPADRETLRQVCQFTTLIFSLSGTCLPGKFASKCRQQRASHTVTSLAHSLGRGAPLRH